MTVRRLCAIAIIFSGCTAAWFVLGSSVVIRTGQFDGQLSHEVELLFFISAAFFAFHLLLAYLVDQIPLAAAFAISAAVSVGLVASYLRVVAGVQRRLWPAAAAQTVYLVAFSSAFFFEGLAGLTVTIGAIITLFVLMQMTARVDWTDTLAAQQPQVRGDAC